MDTGVINPDDTAVGETGTKERRLVYRFLHYWLRLRRGQALPSIDNLDITALPAPWTQCFLMTRSGIDDADEFDHLGDAFKSDQMVVGGNRLESVRPKSLLDYATRPIPVIVAEPVPVISSGSIVTANRRHVRFRSIMLPYAGRTSGNLYLLGSASWRQDVLASPSDMEEFACCKFDHGDWRPVNPPGG